MGELTESHLRVSDDVVRLLQEADVSFELLPHPRTSRAADEAVALHVDADETAKTVIVRSDDELVRAVIPASCRLSLIKLSAVLGSSATILGETELDGAYPQFELGAVPPFGGPTDRVIVDIRISERDSVVLEAGSHELSLRVAAQDLLRVAHAEVADIAI